MTGTVSLRLVLLYTPIPRSLTLGQRLSLMSFSLAYLNVLLSPYCFSTYPAYCEATVIVCTSSYCPAIAIVSWSLLSSGFYSVYRYCLVSPEAQTYCLYCSRLIVPSLYGTINSLCTSMGLSK